MARVEIDQSVLTVSGQSVHASSSATVQVYQRGTTTPVTVYTTESGSTTRSLPLTAVNGRIEGWVTAPASLDLVITDGSDTYTQPFEAVSGAISTGGLGLVVTDPAYGAVADWDAVAHTGTDNTAAFQACIEAARLAHHRTVLVPAGSYKFSGTVTSGEGVKIVCEGSNGTTTSYGVTFVHASNSNFLVWDGSGRGFAGTGGGLKHCLIVKDTGYSGGDAIKLTSTNTGTGPDDHRAGEMEFQDIIILGQTGTWARGLHIDGTLNTTPGGKGIRTVVLNKFRVGACTTNNQYIYINQGLHITGTHVEVDTAGGTGTAGMTITGDSTSVLFSNMNMYANVILSPTAAGADIVLHGRCSALTVGANCRGAFIGYAGSVSNASTLFPVINNDKITAPQIESFGIVSAYKRSSTSLATVGQIGQVYSTTLAPGETFTFTPLAAKLFTIAINDGRAALVFADYNSSTITLVANPSLEFQASSTPSSGAIGVYKSSSSHAISVVSNRASSDSIAILVVGSVLSITDPA